MRRIVKSILLVMMCIALAGCAKEPAPADNITIEQHETETKLADTKEETNSYDTTSTDNEIQSDENEPDEKEVVVKTETEQSTANTNVETNEVEIEETISNLTVHFIDIGQGDCTLIECDGEYMLIDAGENDKGTAVQLYLTKQGVKTLKYFIGTHSDSDHEGGADIIITKFDIEKLFMCDFPKDTRTHEDVVNAANYKGLKWSTPAVGETYSLGGASFTIIAPNKKYDSSNNSSIAILLTNGNNKFVFTGDCEQEAESDIVKNGINIDADVLQVGHHGSHTASSQIFLNAVTPTYAVISCGKDNSYGHPRAETLTKFQTMGIQMFRTDDQGTIICYSDGTNITWNMSPSDNWIPGEPTGSSVNSSTQTESSQNTSNEENQVTTTVQEEASVTAAQTGYSYTVNIKNGKIHYFGAAHGPKEENSKYYATLEEAQVYSASIAGTDDKCKTCFK